MHIIVEEKNFFFTPEIRDFCRYLKIEIRLVKASPVEYFIVRIVKQKKKIFLKSSDILLLLLGKQLLISLNK